MAEVNLKKKLGESDVGLVVIPDAWYPHTILDMTRQVTEDFKNVCYVTMDKLYDSLIRDLEVSGADMSKIFFVDCMSKKTMGRVAESNRVAFISSPYAISELKSLLTDKLKNGNFDVMIFDSLSTLMTYTQVLTAVSLVEAIVRASREAGVKVFFAILEDDAGSPLAKNLSMFVDKAIKL